MPTNQTYYLENDGHTVRNRWFTFPSKQTYYFDNDGHTVKNQWYTFAGNQTYYFNNDGHTVKNEWFTMPTGQTYYFDNNGHTWKYGTPSEINGPVYYTFNAMGEAVGSIKFSNSNIIEYAGHAHTLCKGKNVKYRRLDSGKYLIDYDEEIEGRKTHKTEKLIISGKTWQFGNTTFYKNAHTWLLLIRPEWADKSDFERAEKDIRDNDVDYY